MSNLEKSAPRAALASKVGDAFKIAQQASISADFSKK
jgi:hypothetical protein